MWSSVWHMINYWFKKNVISSCQKLWTHHVQSKFGFFFNVLPLSFLPPSSLQTWLQTTLQQQRGSSHQVGRLSALPGCASTTLISLIHRTHYIQATHLLRTNAMQKQSLLTAESEIECTAVCGGREGCEKTRKVKKKNVPQKCATKKSLWALQLLHVKSN